MPNSDHRDRREMARRGAHPTSANVRFEIIPIRGVDEQLSALPRGATVTVTSSPRLGVARTTEYIEILVRRGCTVVPHLAARQIENHQQLDVVVDSWRELGVREVFVVAGDDRRAAGPFEGAHDLLIALSERRLQFDRIGVACYPEGHPLLDAESLLAELHRKQPLAHYMVSQICFDPSVTAAWLVEIRRAGITLPLYLGVPGVLRRARLLELSLRLGVGSSLRFQAKQRGMGKHFLRRSTFRPDELLDRVGESLSTPELRVAGIHFFTFNEIAATVRWLRRRPAADARNKEKSGR